LHDLVPFRRIYAPINYGLTLLFFALRDEIPALSALIVLHMPTPLTAFAKRPRCKQKTEASFAIAPPRNAGMPLFQRAPVVPIARADGVTVL